ncbi:ACT domain-containing protein [Roseibium salinum]|nr:ACT domain-containing protein [Roseibium salinum]
MPRTGRGSSSEIAEIIAELGGNWIESSMARLGGEFAGIVRIGIAGERSDELIAELQALAADGIDITLRSDVMGPQELEGVFAHLDLVSQDHPGILRDITRVLSDRGVSIEHLETEVAPRLHAGRGSVQGVSGPAPSPRSRPPPR